MLSFGVLAVLSFGVLVGSAGALFVGPAVTRRHVFSRPIMMATGGPISGEGVAPARNVLSTALECCCSDVGGSGIGTGFFRDGYCSTGFQDEGRHTVCVEATEKFLQFSRAVGNDLSTPVRLSPARA